jgi:TrmH family RNA methyltransferase
VYRLGRGVLERVANTVTPQPVLGVVGFVDVGLQALIATSPLVVCADVRDPGNLGAIIRSADAAGVGGIVCTEGTADCYNPKAVRASAGAIFRTPIVVGGGAEAVLDELGGAGFRRLATMAKGGEDYASTDFKGRIAIVFGNEASGVSPTLVPHVDGTVSIPMAHEAESLNVAMAASVLLFEVARRRRFCGTESP